MTLIPPGFCRWARYKGMREKGWIIDGHGSLAQTRSSIKGGASALVKKSSIFSEKTLDGLQMCATLTL